MMKILNSEQIKELDAFTIKHEPIKSIDLMERACMAFTHWFTGRFASNKNIGIVCGTGNNGGDGLGIARLLSGRNYNVLVWIVAGGASESEDFKANQKQLSGKVKKVVITNSPDKNIFDRCDVLIDALFGSGLSRPVDGLYQQAIQCMNECIAHKVAVDIPSGLFTDQHTNGIVFKADHTITFQLPKLSFLLPENENFVGQVEVVDIGLSKDFVRDAGVSHFMIDSNSAAKLLRPRSRFSHKGDYGKALLIAGSKGKMGACVLAGRAAMRAGVGLLTIHVPRNGYTIVQTSVPEAMVSMDSDEDFFSSIPDLNEYSAIGIGPGLGKDNKSLDALKKLLEKNDKPLVIDADALNLLAENRNLLSVIPEQSILTPHPGEFKRLVGEWANDFEKLEKAKEFASKAKSIVVLKGAHTAVVTQSGEIYFNSTGNPGMATGGSGDVLTGVLTGLLAGAYTPEHAALLGVYLHGLAGDLAAADLGINGLIASDIVEHLPVALRNLELNV